MRGPRVIWLAVACVGALAGSMVSAQTNDKAPSENPVCEQLAFVVELKATIENTLDHTTEMHRNLVAEFEDTDRRIAGCYDGTETENCEDVIDGRVNEQQYALEGQIERLAGMISRFESELVRLDDLVRTTRQNPAGASCDE